MYHQEIRQFPAGFRISLPCISSLCHVALARASRRNSGKNRSPPPAPDLGEGIPLPINWHVNFRFVIFRGCSLPGEKSFSYFNLLRAFTINKVPGLVYRASCLCWSDLLFPGFVRSQHGNVQYLIFKSKTNRPFLKTKPTVIINCHECSTRKGWSNNTAYAPMNNLFQ